ncbi:hypothetical protein fugu_005085 [Takifugu bimaculatus]|uniref:PGC-1 and ERR-induced regulator in muscle protein 1 n=1 Tax=Takifugu bimaculatus TaxID=433685 RepID=A0A4Z2B8U5_9TELE|nr:hypothetical protein fugu_005085 [Takifugu bimaculatus]
MDDLDHSMCIAADEWMRFYDKCEECVLPQPLPASPDKWGLSDSEGSDSSAGHEGQRTPATSNKKKRNASRRCREDGNHSLSGGENDDLSSIADSESEIWALCLNYSAINAAEVNTRAEPIAAPLQTEDAQSADDEPKADGVWQSDTSCTRDPLSYQRGAEELTGNEPRGPAGAASGVALSTEKERWFVTVNDSPSRPRVHVTAVKKKRRIKQPRNSKRLSQTTGGEKILVEFKANHERARAKTQVKSTSKRIQKSNVLAKPGLLQKPFTPGQHQGAVYDPSCQVSSPHDVFPSTGLPGLDRVESDELVDTARSCDAAAHLPATESLKEPQQHLIEAQQGAEDTEARAAPSSCSVLADRTPSPPPAACVNKTPGEDAGCDRDARCTQVSTAALTSGLCAHKTNLPPSVESLSGDQISPASVPVFTPSSPADSPDSCAVAAGRPRPVYAISAFWDDMEKVTINDILQLRMAGGASPGLGDKSPHVSLPTNHSSLADSKSAAGVPLDTSDTADSDYFTQLDEPKPDRSGGDLSTSDFEEEQLLGTSSNSSPDLLHSKQTGARCSPYLADEEGESTASEGTETPVPAGDFTQTCLKVQECVHFHSDSLLRPQRLVKSRSMRNVRALRAEDLSLHDDGDSTPVLCSPPDESSREIPFLSKEDVLDNCPQLFCLGDVIGEDKSKSVPGPVLLYDPDPVFDYRLLTFGDEILLTFLRYSRHSEKETIPIFSYSHPPIRTLRFPSHVFPNPVCEMTHFMSPLGDVPGCPSNGGTTAVSPHGHDNNKTFTVAKISLHHKAGIWCRSSGAWMLPLDVLALRGADPPADVVAEADAASAPRRSLSAEQQIWETIITRREGIFSRFSQSDMCLVCIAVASWVLRSADPESADAWKAALLANISALSAIRYLRQYVMQKSSPDSP